MCRPKSAGEPVSGVPPITRPLAERVIAWANRHRSIATIMLDKIEQKNQVSPVTPSGSYPNTTTRQRDPS
jgi:hypothetical protein